MDPLSESNVKVGCNRPDNFYKEKERRAKAKAGELTTAQDYDEADDEKAERV